MLGEDIIRMISRRICGSFDPPFLIDRSTLSRIRNDHLEVISLEVKMGGKHYDILFGVYALCDPSCLQKRGFISAAQLTENYHNGFPHFDAAIDNERFVAEAILPVIQKTIAPFFSRCHDSAAALSESIRTLYFERERQLFFEPQNKSVDTGKFDYAQMIALSPDLFYLAMKSSNRQFMDKHFNAKIDVCLEELDNATMHLDSFRADAEFYINQISQLSEKLLQVENMRDITRNSKRLQELIRKNEQSSLAMRNSAISICEKEEAQY